MKLKGYGIVVCNIPIEKRKTLAFQELSSLKLEEKDIEIDVITDSQTERPNLERIVEECGVKDRIDIYSIDTLLQNEPKKAIEYYTSIIEKEISLLIYDFSGACAKMSFFSNIRLGDGLKGEPFFVKSNLSKEELIARFSNRIYQGETEENVETREDRNEISDVFKDIYFAYESYQTDLTMTMQLLKEFCNIESKYVFFSMSIDYERSLEYESDLQQYAVERPEILEMPKRSNHRPKEYYEILEHMDETISDKRNRVNKAMSELGMFVGYDVFHRWELPESEIVQKPLPSSFNLNEFYSIHIKRGIAK